MCLQPRLRMITDDSVVDVSTKSERLETLTNPKIEQEPAEPGSFQGSRSDRALRIAAYGYCGYWLFRTSHRSIKISRLATADSQTDVSMMFRFLLCRFSIT